MEVELEMGRGRRSGRADLGLLVAETVLCRGFVAFSTPAESMQQEAGGTCSLLQGCNR